MTPYQKAGFNELSLFKVVDGEEFDHGSIVWLVHDDDTTCPVFSDGKKDLYQIIPGHCPADLEELPKDAEGFYLWEGGECPVPGDWEVTVKFGGGPGSAGCKASRWTWEHFGNGGDITAFKPISRPDMPRHSGDANQAESPVVASVECDISGDTSALDVQEGGEHYKKLKIQPMEYSMANSLDACQHTIIKYVTRFRDKGGIEDLRKAKHCIDMLIEFEQQAQEF